MRKKLASFGLVAALAVPLLTTGCTVHAHARVYDSYQHGYRHWNSGEERNYESWEHDTHHQHKDYNQRSKANQDAYWQWRHNHKGNDQH